MDLLEGQTVCFDTHTHILRLAFLGREHLVFRKQIAEKLLARTTKAASPPRNAYTATQIVITNEISLRIFLNVV